MYRISNGLTPPKPLKVAEPGFSEEARREKVSGSVLIGLIVDEKGFLTAVTVVQGIGHGLDEKAVEAVRQYRFQPAVRNGTPVLLRIHIEVNFQIFSNPH